MHESHQDGLGLIVGGVTERDALGADSGSPCLERGVPRGPRRVFEGAPTIHRHGRDVDRDAEAHAEGPDEVGVRGRIGAQLMVDVKDVEPKPPFRGQALQQVQQRHGIGAARDGD